MNGEWQEYTQEFTDEETGIHITVKYDIPDYPLIIATMPDGYVLTGKGNETLKRLLAQAGLPKSVPPRLSYLGECTHHGKLWDDEIILTFKVPETDFDAIKVEATMSWVQEQLKHCTNQHDEAMCMSTYNLLKVIHDRYMAAIGLPPGVPGAPVLPGQVYPPPAPAPGQPAGAQQPASGGKP